MTEAVMIDQNAKTIMIGGAKVEVGVDGSLTIHTNAAVNVKPVEPGEPGSKMTDGSVYAGITADGKKFIFAQPSDLPTMMAGEEAEVAVNALNKDRSLGHNDWIIPDLDTTRVLKAN